MLDASFAASAKGSLRHAAHVLERLFRAHPDEVYEGLLAGDGAPMRLEAL